MCTIEEMIFSFASSDPSRIVQNLQEALAGRELAKMLQFDYNGSTLRVTISKMGTSVLLFSVTLADGKVNVALLEEKIAFTHRMFRDGIVEKLKKVVQGIGGQVV